MKIKCQKLALLKALQSVNAVTVTKDLNPILANVRILTKGKALLLLATDLKISITYTIHESHVEIMEEGDLLLPVAKLYNLVKEISDDSVVLEQNSLTGIITCRDGRYSFQGEDPIKFPEIPVFEEKNSIELAGIDLQKMIKKTIFATSTEKTRYDLDNILGVVKKDSICFVATDGKRLALCEKKCQSTEEFQFTAPSKGLQQIEKILTATNPHLVKLGFLEKQMLFRTQDVTLSTRLSDAKFPPYERVVPKRTKEELPFKAVIPLQEIYSSLLRIGAVLDKKDNAVEAHLTGKDLQIFSICAKSEGNTEKIEISYDGPPISMKFNFTFLTEALRACENNSIGWLIKDPHSPSLISDGGDFCYVILPIKKDEPEPEKETKQC